MRRNVADFLFDVEPDISVDVDAGRNPQDDAGVAIIDGVDDRVACRQHRGAAGGDRHDVADLKRRDLIVDHNQGRVGQHLDAGDGMQRVQNCARLRLRSDQEIEPGECAIDEGVDDRSGRRRALGAAAMDAVVDWVLRREPWSGLNPRLWLVR